MRIDLNSQKLAAFRHDVQRVYYEQDFFPLYSNGVQLKAKSKQTHMLREEALVHRRVNR